MLISEIPFDAEKGLEGLPMLRQDPSALKSKGIRFSVFRRPSVGKPYLDTYIKQPCHGLLRGGRAFEMCATGIDFDEMPTVYSYFVNESPFSRFVLNRDTFVEDGFIAVTGDLWYPFQNCLNIFCRATGEGLGPAMEGMFKKLLNMGTPPLVALLVVTSTTMLEDGLNEFTNVAFRSGHSLVSNLSVDGAKNFLSSNAVGYVQDSTNRPTIAPGDYYRGVYVWERNRQSSNSATSWLNTLYYKNEDQILSKRGSKKSLSPFHQQPTNLKILRRSEFYDYALPFLVDLYDANRIATPVGETSSGPSGEIVRPEGFRNIEPLQAYDDAFARVVGVRN